MFDLKVVDVLDDQRHLAMTGKTIIPSKQLKSNAGKMQKKMHFAEPTFSFLQVSVLN